MPTVFSEGEDNYLIWDHDEDCWHYFWIGAGAIWFYKRETNAIQNGSIQMAFAKRKPSVIVMKILGMAGLVHEQWPKLMARATDLITGAMLEHRTAAIHEAARAQCQMCRDGMPLEYHPRLSQIEGEQQFIHRFSDGATGFLKCEATKIWRVL